MSKLFQKNGTLNIPEHQKLENRYKGSINNLLVIVLFSVVNIVLLVTNANSYFLFSAFIPYFLADYGMYYCGMYPEDYYYDIGEMEFLDKSYFVYALVIAAVILLVYLLCWFMAKKKKIGWVIAALIFFALDTAAMLFFMGINMDMFMDILIHIWVFGYMINAIVVYRKMKKAPETEEITEEAFVGQDYPQIPQNSKVLRMADTDVKSKTFLEAEKFGHVIVYRRVKTTNELVVDGRVYDEYVALVEAPHNLVAEIDGHIFEAGMMNPAWSYIKADGEMLTKKIRLV